MAGVKSALCSAAAVVLGACAPYAASRLGLSGLPFEVPRDFLDGNSGRLAEFFAAANPLFAAVLLYGFSLAAFLVSGARGRTPTVAARILAAAVATHAAGAGVAAFLCGGMPPLDAPEIAVFMGIAAAVLGLLLYAKNRGAECGASGASAGLLSLLVANADGAVGSVAASFDSNLLFWTYYAAVVAGFGGSFLCGFAATFRIAANPLSRGNFGIATGDTAKTAYGLQCFSLFFLLAGTMLGGIWSDCVWGRFWSWDSREIGVFAVILWTAAATHARRFKLLSDRGYLGMAVLGNALCAWAVFGIGSAASHSVGEGRIGLYLWAFAGLEFAAWLLTFYKYAEKRGTGDKKSLN